MFFFFKNTSIFHFFSTEILQLISNQVELNPKQVHIQCLGIISHSVQRYTDKYQLQNRVYHLEKKNLGRKAFPLMTGVFIMRAVRVYVLSGSR